MTVELLLRDKRVDLSRHLLANGSLQVQHIDNGFILNCVTVRLPIPQPVLAGMAPIQARSRMFFCATVDELTKAVAALMQLPWRQMDEVAPESPAGATGE